MWNEIARQEMEDDWFARFDYDRERFAGEALDGDHEMDRRTDEEVELDERFEVVQAQREQTAADRFLASVPASMRRAYEAHEARMIADAEAGHEYDMAVRYGYFNH